MNKAELIEALADKTSLSKKEVNAVFDAFTQVVGEVLGNGDKIVVAGFGSFEVSERAARQGKNPRTGETLEIAATKVPKFKAGATLKARVAL